MEKKSLNRDFPENLELTLFKYIPILVLKSTKSFKSLGPRGLNSFIRVVRRRIRQGVRHLQERYDPIDGDMFSRQLFLKANKLKKRVT